MSIKNIYFGPVTAEQLSDSGSDGYFMFRGKYWAYHLEVDFEEGMLRFTDSVGRMVPIDKDVYNQLIQSIAIVKDSQDGYDTLAAQENEVVNLKQDFVNALDDFAHDDHNYYM